MLAQRLDFPAGAPLLRRGRWLLERKLDGLRCLAVRDGDRVDLWSRNHLSFNRRFPGLVHAVASVPVDRFVLDGEVVAFDGDRTSFQLLQSGSAEPVLVVFDRLHLLGSDLRALALTERAGLLDRLMEGAPTQSLQRCERLNGDPAELMARACAEEWEGLVAKKAGSAYRSGRSADWRKLKCTARQELVIGGWTDPAGGRTGFGALLLGYYRGDELVYAGKVGTGFDESTLKDLQRRLAGSATHLTPFRDAPAVKGAHWVEPVLVAEIEFSEWTRDGRLRHPAYVGLRQDKDPRSVGRESLPTADG